MNCLEKTKLEIVDLHVVNTWTLALLYYLLGLYHDITLIGIWKLITMEIVWRKLEMESYEGLYILHYHFIEPLLKLIFNLALEGCSFKREIVLWNKIYCFVFGKYGGKFWKVVWMNLIQLAYVSLVKDQKTARIGVKPSN